MWLCKGEKSNSKNKWRNGEVKPVVERKAAAWKDVLETMEDVKGINLLKERDDELIIGREEIRIR